MDTAKPTQQKASFIAFASVAKPQRLSFLGTDMRTVRKALEEVYGNFPIRLSKRDANIIAGMCAASGEGRAPYEQLCQALDQFGELELSLEA